MIKVSDIYDGVEIETLGGIKDIINVDYDLSAGYRGKVYKDDACQWAVRLNEATWQLNWFKAGDAYFGFKLVDPVEHPVEHMLKIS